MWVVLGLMAGMMTEVHASPVALDQAGVEVDLTEAVLQTDPTPDTVVVDGEWRLVHTLGGVRTWEIALPTRTRTLFFHRPPSGMEVVRRDSTEVHWDTAHVLKHRPGGDTVPATWTFDSHSLQVRRLADAGPPPPGVYGMRFPEATDREADLRTPGDDPTDFVVRSLQLGDTTRHGLFLVPGSTVRATVSVPEGGQLRFDAVSVPPEAAAPSAPRDGQALTVRVVPPEGEAQVVWHSRPADHLPSSTAIDLSPWAGQEITVELEAPTDDTDLHDAVFVADPVVLSPRDAPKRVVVVFIDTLRQDALSLYGNPEPTSPGIDRWAQDATVFTAARSVAPWTLPTARSLFSGRAPELWGRTPSLADLLRADGWATAFIAGNIYLSSNFDMAGGWSTHRCINWPQAEVQVDRAERWLAAQDDRPALLILHLMDMHLPYTEPAEFRDRFAGPTPEPFASDVFHRNQVVQWARDMDDDDRAWLRGRYHNNLAYIDSVLTPFLEALPPDTTVLLLSDHGEEFWDHGDFEHGHTLYEELLRVPLVARGPDFAAGRVEAPTSLLDVAPTILRVAGINAELEGIPLQDIAADPAAHMERAVAFGRPLYGQRRWGVVQGDRKYTTWKSTERLVDLQADPEEEHNLIDGDGDAAAWRQVLSEALRTPVYVAWSLYPQRSSRAEELRVEVTPPDGILHAWAAEDPTLMSAVTTDIRPDAASHTWAGHRRGTREAYVVPLGDALALLPDTEIQVTVGDTTKPLPVPDTPPVLDGRNHIIGRVRVEGRSVSLQAAVVPLPPDESVGIEGYNKEVEAELEALGYLDH